MYPKTGRVGVFHGDYLQAWFPDGCRAVFDEDALAARYRVTLAIAFWAHMEGTLRRGDRREARPFHPPTRPVKWRGDSSLPRSGLERFRLSRRPRRERRPCPCETSGNASTTRPSPRTTRFHPTTRVSKDFDACICNVYGFARLRRRHTAPQPCVPTIIARRHETRPRRVGPRRRRHRRPL